MKPKKIRWRLARDMWDVVRAATPTHEHLRDRLVSALVLTLIVDAVGSAAMYFVETGASASGLYSFGDALYWTTSQLTTLGSPKPNPVTRFGQIIAVCLSVYAITVVSTLAGMFSAFFHRRGEERSPQHRHDAS